jgi:hypothetical protein
LLAGLAISLHVGFVVFVIFGGLALYRWSWGVWLHVPAVVYAIPIQTIGWPRSPFGRDAGSSFGVGAFQRQLAWA